MDPATDSKSSPESTLNDGSEPQAVVVRREPERDIVTWTAVSRPFRRRDRQFYVTTFAIAGIVSLVLFLAEGIMPVLLIVSLVFLYYVLSTVEPEKIEYKITNKGIKFAGKRTEWQFLNRFWFSERFGSQLLVIETFQIPGRIEIVINPEIKESLKKEISAYIPFEEAAATNYDKVTNWFTSKLPGN
ncbi:MAG TPA: hypothetical protein VKC54_01745 [Patescibacteria group bacterium]|nr:hypothetical protein [Patescibacteria group bacterium]